MSNNNQANNSKITNIKAHCINCDFLRRQERGIRISETGYEWQSREIPTALELHERENPKHLVNLVFSDYV